MTAEPDTPPAAWRCPGCKKTCPADPVVCSSCGYDSRDDAPAAPEVVRNARSLAHNAVTEGVNLKYVERMRQELYALADAYEKLDARLQGQEGPSPYSYRLVVEGDAYELLTSLHEVATAACADDSFEVSWLARSDEEVARERRTSCR